MTFPPGSAPTIPALPAKGAMNWDTPLDAVLNALSDGFATAWQNSVDMAVAVGRRAITPVVNAGSEISNPADGQLCYVTSTHTYLRYDATSTSWVAFLTRGADGSYINSFQGAWTAKSYATGQIVTYLGSSWIATGAVSSSQIPGTDAAWTAIAASGTPGTAGNTVLNGTSNPSSGTGNNGDFYINTSTSTVFGPKASGAWPSGVSMVGPTGPAGQGVATAGTTGQYLKKASGTNYDTGWGAILDADINALGSVTNKALDSAVVHNTGAETVAGVKTFSSAPVVPSNAFPESAITNLTTDLAAKLPLAGGTMTGAIAYTGAGASTIGSQSQVTGDSNQRFTRRLDGQMAWGSGSGATDTTFRRNAAGVLVTDNTFGALTGVQVGAVSPSFGGGVGVVGMTNASTAPTTNPSGGGVFYADSNSKPAWRDPNGNVWSLIPPSKSTPADQNLLAWTYEPNQASGTPSALTAGVILLARVLLKTAATVNNIIVNVTTAAAGNSNTYVALIDFSGNRQGLSADQSTAFQSTGLKTVALTTPYAAPQGSYWVALLVGAATTAPQFSSANSSNVPAALANAGLTASTARWATTGSSLTAIPSTITPSSNTTSNLSIFAALS